jgi:hypothetical protein
MDSLLLLAIVLGLSVGIIAAMRWGGPSIIQRRRNPRQ